MTFCPACGSQMYEAATACPSCGRPNGMVPAAPENKSWFSFQGRIPRKEYWLHYQLPLFVIPFLVGFIDALLKLGGVLSGIASIVLLIPAIAGSVKRAHDRARSGWFLLLYLLPVIGWIWVFVELGFLRGTTGPNRFGRDPLNPIISRASAWG